MFNVKLICKICYINLDIRIILISNYKNIHIFLIIYIIKYYKISFNKKYDHNINKTK